MHICGIEMIHDKSLSPFIVESIQNYGVYCVRAMRPNFFYMKNNEVKGVWISRDIWLDKNLSCTEKCLLAEIDSLDNDKGCFASNEYLGDFIGVTAGRCANIISDLRKRGYLKTTFTDGNNRILSVLFSANRLHENVKDIYENNNPASRKREGKLHENVKGGSRKREGKLHENVNIYNRDNNSYNNSDKEIEKVIVENKNIIEEVEREIVSARASEKTPIVLTDYRAVVEQPDNFVYLDPDQLKTTILNWCTENIETVMMWYSEVKTVYVHENARQLIRTFIAYYSEDKAFNRDPVRFFRIKYIKWLIREKNGFTKK
jgi:hypothetical protein